MGPRDRLLIIADMPAQHLPTLTHDAWPSPSRLRVICNETNQGLAHSRNKAMKEATTRHIIFLDDDITPTAYALKEMRDALTAGAHITGTRITAHLQGHHRPWSVATTLAEHAVDVVHDHSDGVMLPPYLALPTVGTHHLTGVPAVPVNCIYVSEAQHRQAGSSHAPVIRLPVDADHCEFSIAKQDYLLYIGRVSRHKGVHEAAAFAAAAGLPLRIAEPAWEKDYFNILVGQYPHTVDCIGEVGPQQRAQLIADARALLVLSQPAQGPFGTE